MHWRTLTYGWYWLQAGEDQLFRHSPELVAHWKQLEWDNPRVSEEIKKTPWNPHVEYYVAQL